MNRSGIYGLVDAERARQINKWHGTHAWGAGDCSTSTVPDPVKMAVLTEEVGEVAKSMLDGDTDNLKDELVQVAAVAVAWLEALS